MLIDSKAFFLLLIFISGFCCADIQSITDDKVIFDNGYEVELKKFSEYFSNPKEAVKKGLPVSVEEQAVSLWGSVLILRKLNYFEGAITELQLLDKDAQVSFPALRFSGELVLLEKKNSFVIAGVDAHNRLDNTFVYTREGVLKNKITHQGIFGVGASEDDSIFWLLQSDIDDGKPITSVFAYDYSGELIFESSVDKSTELNLVYQGKTYVVNVPAPDFPG